MTFKFPAIFWHTFILIFVCLLFLSSLWNFKTGFLLSRTALENRSSCQNPFRLVSDRYDQLLFTSLEVNDDSCWQKGRFSRAVVLLVDGLRFDFAFPPKRDGKTLPYHHCMPIFNATISSSPSNAFLAPFIADPPTTTLQRLQGLTSGTLPTFIDVASNFGGTPLVEDSFVAQAKNLGRKIVFMGDDTWKDLFPDMFHRSFFYPSFNVKDLHTVDNGVWTHLLPEIAKPDWDIIMAHFLGVDHCGHHYGPFHPEMTAKLKQMNLVIKSVMSTLKNDTVLFVIGDHGMTSTGDHGGDSVDEISSAIFVYNPQELKKPTLNKLRPVPQVDFVPTLSLLLGLPIPFSSIGSIIPDLFNRFPWKISNDLPESLRNLLWCCRTLSLNAFQMKHYLETYVKAAGSDFSSDDIKSLQEQWINLIKLESEILKNDFHANHSQLTESLEKLKDSFVAYLRNNRQLCSEKWVQFEELSMHCSTVQLLVILLATFALSIYVFLGQLELTKTCHKLIIGACFGTAFTLTFYHFNLIPKETLIIRGSFIINGCSLLALLEWNLIIVREGIRKLFQHLDSPVMLLLSAFHFLSFFSNSFVVNENRISTFLLLTFIVYTLVMRVGKAARSKEDALKPFSKVYGLPRWFWCTALCFSLMILTRASLAFHKCREEHGLSCQSSLFIKSVSELPEDWSSYRSLRISAAIGSLTVFLASFTFFFRYHQSKYRDNLTAVLVSYASPLVGICIVANWLISSASKATVAKLLSNKQEAPAQFAAIVSSLNIAAAVVFPVTIAHSSLSQRSKWTQFHQTVVFNTALLVLSISLMSILLSGDGLSIALILFYALFACYSFLWMELETKYPTLEENFLSLFNLGLFLSALSSVGFFATGHQTVLSSIHWNSAFVLSKGDYQGKILPMVTIIFETFSSQMTLVLSMPLLVSLMELLRFSNGKGMLMVEDILNSKTRGILPSLGPSSINPSVGSLSRFENSLLTLQLSFLFGQALKLSGCVLSACLLKRHLMVWKIFAPRLIFEAFSFLITVISLLFTHLFTVRIIVKLNN